ncbi:MAG: transcriptional regulator [Robiginitomaculum sp.]|nr:transcriptional regulator [Robiginitomaculum sp.]
MTDETQKLGSTRRAIIERLKLSGARSANALADELGVSAMAVRQHLYELQEQKLVVASNIAQSRGRPIKNWGLSQQATKLFPDAHQDLAVELLDNIRSLFGENALEQVIDKHTEKQTKAYNQAISTTDELEQKLDKLAKIRTKEGYMAEVQTDGKDYLFIENHCPICAAASTCTRLCANELSMFQNVLGKHVSIIREEHILDDNRRCLYRIKSA